MHPMLRNQALVATGVLTVLAVVAGCAHAPVAPTSQVNAAGKSRAQGTLRQTTEPTEALPTVKIADGTANPYEATVPAADQAPASGKAGDGKWAWTQAKPIHRRAEWEARRWDMGARLACADAQWVDTNARAVRRWELTYVSPFQYRNVFKGIDDGVLRVGVAPRMGWEREFNENDWKLDLDQAIQQARSYGMFDTLIPRAILGSVPETGYNLAWTFDTQRGRWQIHARTGALLQKPAR